MQDDSAFANLALQARHGDEEARELVRQRLDETLLAIVRATLNAVNAATPLARRVKAVARMLAAETSSPSPNVEHLARRVARRIGQAMLNNLRPESDRLQAQETVMDRE